MYDPENPLPDSDIVVDDAVTVTETKTRRTFSRDGGVVTMHEGGVATVFVTSSLPTSSTEYLVYLGLTAFLSRSDDVTAQFKRLVDGEEMGKKGKPASAKAVDLWRQAIALAYVETTKKAPAGQMTLEVATAKAIGLDKDKVKRLKLDPAVVKHYNKIAGAEIGYSLAASLAESEVAA